MHGIGEQRRYEHLDEQIRGIIAALGHLALDQEVSVQIVQSDGGANLAAQDSWSGGSTAPIRILLRRVKDSELVELKIHEVWWADVNEPDSLMKQVRFWFWSNTIWNLAKKLKSKRPMAGKENIVTLEPALGTLSAVRGQIFLLGNLLLLATLSIGLVFPLLKRLLGIDLPVPVKVVTSYMSSLKLYNQKERSGLGAIPPPPNADYLDTIGEPPRVSIRRRVVQSIADVACAGYDRWYILAHSLGSVVAFNGLMEPGYVFANYLDEKRWLALTGKGMTRIGAAVPRRTGHPMMPRRPLWIPSNATVDRPRMFERFRGLVTYGSPIGKFGAIWPARAPICVEPAFHNDSLWLNVFDPLDPVSGPADNYTRHADGALRGRLQSCPTKVNLPYAAGDVFGLAHIKYLADTRQGALAHQLGRFMLEERWPTGTLSGRFYSQESLRRRWRQGIAVASLTAIHLSAVVLAAITLTNVWRWVFAVLHWQGLESRLPEATLAYTAEQWRSVSPMMLGQNAWLWATAGWVWIRQHWIQVPLTLGAALTVSFVAGLAGRAFKPLRPDEE